MEQRNDLKADAENARQLQSAEESFYMTPNDEKPNQPLDERVRLSAKGVVDSLIRKELPLQNETSYFILANMLDFFMTYMLLAKGAMETNPVADFFYKNWGHVGMLAFKLVSVAFICILAQIIAKKSIGHARFVLVVGTLIVGAVVIYSGKLLYGLLYA